MMKSHPSLAPFLGSALVLAFALGACTGGDKGHGTDASASDTVAWRAAIALTDTTLRMKALEVFLAQYPETPFRGRAYRRLFDLKQAKTPEQAVAFLRQGLADEKDPDVRGTLHIALFERVRADSPAEVEATARAALADPAPLPSHVFNAMGWELVEAGEHLDLAVELAKMAVARSEDPGDKAGSLDTQGWAEFKQGDFPEAVELLEAARTTSPESSEEIDTHLAHAYQAAGKKVEARDLYLELLLNQENPEMRQAVSRLFRELGGSAAAAFRDIDRRREEKATPAADFALKDYSGKEIHLSDFKGSIVLLNFWHPT